MVGSLDTRDKNLIRLILLPTDEKSLGSLGFRLRESDWVWFSGALSLRPSHLPGWVGRCSLAEREPQQQLGPFRGDLGGHALEHVPDAIRDLTAGRIAGKAAVVIRSS